MWKYLWCSLQISIFGPNADGTGDWACWVQLIPTLVGATLLLPMLLQQLCIFAEALRSWLHCRARLLLLLLDTHAGSNMTIQQQCF